MDKEKAPASSKNPHSNPVLQAFLDAQAAGYGTMSVDAFIQLMNADSSLAHDFATRFNSRDYRTDRLEYIQLSIDQRLMDVSAPALKILMFLAMYAAPDGLVSIQGNDLGFAVGMPRKATRLKYIKELKDCGLLIERDGSYRHEPPIWQVNPRFLHKGKRQHVRRHTNDFETHMPHVPNRFDPNPDKAYICNWAPILAVSQDRVRRQLTDEEGTVLYYTRLSLVSPDVDTKKDPQDGRTSQGSGTDEAAAPVAHGHYISPAQSGQGQDDEDYDGFGRQMEPDVLPDDTGDAPTDEDFAKRHAAISLYFGQEGDDDDCV